jgi:ATP phosphoribosyltransferase regulatory subunit
VLRVKGSEIRPERQIGQVGGELIGAEGPAADIEAIAVAGEAIARLGVSHLSVDITLPTLVPAIAEAYDIGGARAAALRAALDHKDAAGVAAVAGAAGELLEPLLAAAGPAARTLAALDRLVLPVRARAERIRLDAVLDGLATAAPELKVTVDPVENRGFEYHTGISFTFFADGPAVNGSPGELGAAGGTMSDPAHRSPRLASSLYRHDPSSVCRRQRPRRVLLPLGAGRARAGILRRAGWVTRNSTRQTIGRPGIRPRLQPCLESRRGGGRGREIENG